MAVIAGAKHRVAVTAGGSADAEGYLMLNAGTPTAGTTGAGWLEAGGLVIDTTNKKLFINTGTKASPSFTVVGSQS